MHSRLLKRELSKCQPSAMAKESSRMETGINKDTLKQALTELLQEMPMFGDLTAGSSSLLGPPSPGPSMDSTVTKASGASSKCG